jgi:hypothetical protein
MNITQEKLDNMSIEKKLGFAQHLAGLVWEKEDLCEDIRDDALCFEEISAKRLQNLFLGKCSLRDTLDFDPEESEKELDERILNYQKLLEGG